MNKAKDEFVIGVVVFGALADELFDTAATRCRGTVRERTHQRTTSTDICIGPVQTYVFNAAILDQASSSSWAMWRMPWDFRLQGAQPSRGRPNPDRCGDSTSPQKGRSMACPSGLGRAYWAQHTVTGPGSSTLKSSCRRTRTRTRTSGQPTGMLPGEWSAGGRSRWY